MGKYATESLNYYFYEESEDKDGMFTVFFGNNESQFMAGFIAEFAAEEDANEYVEWKNEQLEASEGNALGEVIAGYDDVDLDEEAPEDLVTLMGKVREGDDGW